MSRLGRYRRTIQLPEEEPLRLPGQPSQHPEPFRQQRQAEPAAPRPMQEPVPAGR